MDAIPFAKIAKIIAREKLGFLALRVVVAEGDASIEAVGGIDDLVDKEHTIVATLDVGIAVEDICAPVRPATFCCRHRWGTAWIGGGSCC